MKYHCCISIYLVHFVTHENRSRRQLRIISLSLEFVRQWNKRKEMQIECVIVLCLRLLDPKWPKFITIAIHIKKNIILVIKTKTLTSRERFGIGGCKLHCAWLYALAKRTRKSTQVKASLQNQNLRTDLRRVAKRIRKSARKSKKP